MKQTVDTTIFIYKPFTYSLKRSLNKYQTKTDFYMHVKVFTFLIQYKGCRIHNFVIRLLQLIGKAYIV